MTRPSRSRGFTLLEVLIAIVILSIGLLGIAALQGIGLRSSQGAYLTSQASLLAYDMADRIRANPQPEGTYTFDPATAALDCTQPRTTPLEEADIDEWACAVQALLPNGSAQIEDVRNGMIFTYTITIEWEDLQAEEGSPWSYQLVINL